MYNFEIPNKDFAIFPIDNIQELDTFILIGEYRDRIDKSSLVIKPDNITSEDFSKLLRKHIKKNYIIRLNDKYYKVNDDESIDYIGNNYDKDSLAVAYAGFIKGDNSEFKFTNTNLKG